MVMNTEYDRITGIPRTRVYFYWQQCVWIKVPTVDIGRSDDVEPSKNHLVTENRTFYTPGPLPAKTLMLASVLEEHGRMRPKEMVKITGLTASAISGILYRHPDIFKKQVIGGNSYYILRPYDDYGDLDESDY